MTQKERDGKRKEEDKENKIYLMQTSFMLHTRGSEFKISEN